MRSIFLLFWVVSPGALATFTIAIESSRSFSTGTQEPFDLKSCFLFGQGFGLSFGGFTDSFRYLSVRCGSRIFYPSDSMAVASDLRDTTDCRDILDLANNELSSARKLLRSYCFPVLRLSRIEGGLEKGVYIVNFLNEATTQFLNIQLNAHPVIDHYLGGSYCNIKSGQKIVSLQPTLRGSLVTAGLVGFKRLPAFSLNNIPEFLSRIPLRSPRAFYKAIEAYALNFKDWCGRFTQREYFLDVDLLYAWSPDFSVAVESEKKGTRCVVQSVYKPMSLVLERSPDNIWYASELNCKGKQAPLQSLKKSLTDLMDDSMYSIKDSMLLLTQWGTMLEAV